MITDVTGTAIVPGSVITWCGRQSSAMFLSVGVVRTCSEEMGGWNKTQLFHTIAVDRLGDDQQIRQIAGISYVVRSRYFKPVKLTNIAYITVTGLTEAVLKERFPFGERIEEMARRA